MECRLSYCVLRILKLEFFVLFVVVGLCLKTYVLVPANMSTAQTLLVLLASTLLSTSQASPNYLDTQHTIASTKQVEVGSKNFIQQSIFRPVQTDNFKAQHLEPTPPTFGYTAFDNDLPYSGIATFAHLNYTNCYAADNNGTFDIAIVGAPFDLGVSYRPGARFGPNGARMGARRISPSAGWRCVQIQLRQAGSRCADHSVVWTTESIHSGTGPPSRTVVT